MKVQLKKHDRNYTEIMSELLSEPPVQQALQLNWQQVSINGTRDYIDFVQGEERMGKQVSRVIFNEQNELVGVTTLKRLNFKEKTAHIGTWLGAKYWGKGYNEQSKNLILAIAFEQLELEAVFAGAKISNSRSLAAQRKLPYITNDVGHQYPEQLKIIEDETGEKCILNIIKKEDFLAYMNKENTKVLS